MQKKVWLINGDTAKYVSLPPDDSPTLLPNGIYEPILTLSGYYLQKIGDKFTFDYKIYGLETDFLDRVIRYYKATDNNLGILLNGVKGTGKTVIAKTLANSFNLPIILVKNNTDGLLDYISELNQPLTIFIDEYEKTFKESFEILAHMDGAAMSDYRRVWLFTTNNLYVESNLLDRPSRIRYLKQFNNLHPSIITSIVSDSLERPEFFDEVMSYVSSLKNLTVDIVKSIVQEVNIQNESPFTFKNSFNASLLDGSYTLTLFRNDGTSVVLDSQVKLNRSYLDYSIDDVDNNIYFQGAYVGRISQVLNEQTILISIQRSLEDILRRDNGSAAYNELFDYLLNDTNEEFSFISAKDNKREKMAKLFNLDVADPDEEDDEDFDGEETDSNEKERKKTTHDIYLNKTIKVKFGYSYTRNSDFYGYEGGGLGSEFGLIQSQSENIVDKSNKISPTKLEKLKQLLGKSEQ